MTQYSKLIVGLIGIAVLVGQRFGVDVCAAGAGSIGDVAGSAYTTAIVGVLTAMGIYQARNKQ